MRYRSCTPAGRPPCPYSRAPANHTAINAKRLCAVPWAAHCVGCQEAADRHGLESDTSDSLQIAPSNRGRPSAAKALTARGPLSKPQHFTASGRRAAAPPWGSSLRKRMLLLHLRLLAMSCAKCSFLLLVRTVF